MERYRLAPMRDARTRDERVKRGDLAGAVGDAQVTAALKAEEIDELFEPLNYLGVADQLIDRAIGARKGLPPEGQ